MQNGVRPSQPDAVSFTINSTITYSVDRSNNPRLTSEIKSRQDSVLYDLTGPSGFFESRTRSPSVTTATSTQFAVSELWLLFRHIGVSPRDASITTLSFPFRLGARGPPTPEADLPTTLR